MVRYEPVIWDIATTGLNPMAEYWWSNEMAAQVTAFGMATVDGWRNTSDPDMVDIDVTVLYDADEYRLLNVAKDRFWKAFTEAYVDDDGSDEDGEDVEPLMVGFNSRQYDHPYAGARYSRKRINGEPFSHGAKRLDMMRVASNKTDLKGYPSQDEYAKYLGEDIPDEFDGSMMPGFFDNGHMDKIASHVEADAKELARLFVVDKEDAMEEFYNHYDIDKSPVFNRGVTEW